MARVGTLLRFRNKLAYPCGVAPGLDLTHFAVSKAINYISAIAYGNDFINLRSGGSGTQSGTITSKINGNIGPTVIFGATGSDFITMSNPAATVTIPAAKTYGVIFISTGSGAFQFIFSDTNASSTDAIAISSSNTLEFFGFGGATGQIDSGMTVTANIPYFAALSINSGTANFILRNLLNGKTTTFTTTGGALQASDSPFEIGNVTASHVFTGGIAAVAYSWIFLSLSQLQAWAADPWAFWYPDSVIDWVGVAAQAATHRFPLRMRMGMGV